MWRLTNESTSRQSRQICGCGIFGRFMSIGILLQIIANCDYGAGAIRSVHLVVDPPAVRRSQHATLRCLYDLDDSPLYSVKFYRGLREFYRFSPSEYPEKKTFPFPGINVDLSLSNASQVVIRNVGFGLSGNFSCEVTADAPSYSTATGHIQMQVVELPDSGPTLWTEHNRYEAGDVLRANCSSPPSRPKADLKLTLNNIVIFSSDQTVRTTTDNLMTTAVSLRLHLQSSHFSGVQLVGSSGSGTLVLRCTATIGKLYEQYTELELGVPQRDPVPARVTLTGSSSSGRSPSTMVLVVCLLLLSLQTSHRLAEYKGALPVERR
ncbi:uncharacterized protein LOC129763284 [Toxorhynchites rutilus septentrionalis]|uniref:uncharacterized protein LOC129763284 n=1 Tax=Toxorhynchites rutilus septentrionalis TaxID=329112 RepID=UPI00247A73D1|nr:uncharacterized protein LOC129763284 [Toxorhynchites rutilus septentrionalis]XP_055618169.1 uncharacterized protein LOC129763284 [Toxorhynchites rutilus septentrionalis]